jgi:hypothetical protein
LAAQVTEWLQEWWSPQEISHRLRIDFAEDPMMHAGHADIIREAIDGSRGL